MKFPWCYHLAYDLPSWALHSPPKFSLQDATVYCSLCSSHQGATVFVWRVTPLAHKFFQGLGFPVSIFFSYLCLLHTLCSSITELLSFCHSMITSFILSLAVFKLPSFLRFHNLSIPSFGTLSGFSLQIWFLLHYVSMCWGRGLEGDRWDICIVFVVPSWGQGLSSLKPLFLVLCILKCGHTYNNLRNTQQLRPGSLLEIQLIKHT